jgi:hypothetical protein
MECNESPGSKGEVLSFQLLQGNSVAMAECSGMVRKNNASLKERLKKHNKRASK